MKTLSFVALTAALFSGCLLVSAQSQAPAQKQTATAQSAAEEERKEGERRFRANCGRCHNPPESLSPHEVKAVLQQMRVRAMLSAEDELLIRKYLAP
jgi:cytochrome c5